LRGAVLTEKRLPMADATESFSEMADGTSLFFAVEREAKRQRQPAGTGIKKSGWRGAYQTRMQRQNELLHR